MVDFVQLARESGYLCFDVEYDEKEVGGIFSPGFKIHGCGFASLSGNEIVKEYVTDLGRIKSIIDSCFPDPNIQIVAHNAKFDILCLKIIGLLPCDPQIRCTQIALNLLDENLLAEEIGLKPTVQREYGHKMKSFKEASVNGLDTEMFREYAEEDVYYELRLYLDLEPLLKPFYDLYTKIMMPSVLTFADMEYFGIHWDQDKSDEFYRKLYIAREQLVKQIYKKIGRLNLDSSIQLSKRLFDELGYSTQYTERGKNGAYCLDAGVMDQMASRYEVCNWIRAYRSCQKLIGTYLEPIQMQCMLNYDSRIHSNYYLTSKTGRTRCVRVNNQNMPVAVGDDLGDLAHIFEDVRIRSACNCPPGRKLVISDFSQLELRLSGHSMGERDFIKAYCDWTCWECSSSGSSDKTLHKCPECGEIENEKAAAKQKGFWHGRDLHTEVLDYVPQKVRERIGRKEGKALNFAIIFNAGGWRLHYEHPQISPEEWQSAIDAIMENRPNAKRYHENSANLLRSKGERESLFGRKRRIPKSQYTVKGVIDKKKLKSALNEFINAPIQGDGALLCQLAMVKLRKCWIEKGWWGSRAKLVNMIHDELVAEVDEEIAEEASYDMQYWMENAASFSVPIRASRGTFESWDQSK